MKERIKKPRDWTIRDFIDYVSNRIEDCNWTTTTAVYLLEWFEKMPRLFRKNGGKKISI